MEQLTENKTDSLILPSKVEDQPPVGPPIRMCEKCNLTLVHFEEIEDNHETCICYAIEYRAVCCPLGFRNLLKTKPALTAHFSTHFNAPHCLNSDVLYSMTMNFTDIHISYERTALIKAECYEFVNQQQYSPQNYLATLIADRDSDPYWNDNNYKNIALFSSQ